MTAITFDDSLKVHVKELDEQHKQLIAILNQLDKLRQGEEGTESLDEVLADLAAYVDYHFAAEEELFKKYNYPDAVAHDAEHRHYAEKIKEFSDQYQADKAIGLPDEVFHFLVEWIMHHIKQVDRQYSKFLNAQGVC